MTIRDFDRSARPWLKSSDLENLFPVFSAKLNRYMYNLNMSLYVDVDPEKLSTFTLQHDMHWPLISYHIYGTTRLAWLLQKVNNVSTKDIFKVRCAAEKIKYLEKDQVARIINLLNTDN